MFCTLAIVCKRAQLIKSLSCCVFGKLQYFLPFYKDNINKHIEKAILNADTLGVKVISLAALNKVNSSSCFKRVLISATRCTQLHLPTFPLVNSGIQL
jgi:hypothetical protein